MESDTSEERTVVPDGERRTARPTDAGAPEGDSVATGPETGVGVETEHDRLVRRQSALLDFIETISSELELQPLLTRILQSACELIGADHGTIGLVDPKQGIVRTAAIHNMPEDELGAVMLPGVGIAGHVLLTKKPIVLDRYRDVKRPSRYDSQDNPVIGMPIPWRGRMIGFFGIGIHADAAVRAGRPVHRFTERDLESLAVFARHAAIAISNARQYEREQERTERFGLIARIGHIITANLSLPDLLQRAADAIHELLGYPNVAIPLLEAGDPPVLVLNTVGGAYKHIVKDEYRLPVTEGIMGAAARTNEVVLVNDVRSDPRHVPTPGASGINAELAVPIRLGGRVLGILNVECSDEFTEEDAASLEIVADQLAVAIENARLYDRGQRVAVLEERQRLARDLHDSVTQHIFGMNLIAQSLSPAWRRDAAEAERRTERLVELGRTALSEMRALLVELRPDVAAAERAILPGLALLRAKGLVVAIEKHITGLAGNEPAIELDARHYRRQDAHIEEALFRITQEALANVVKHSNARIARVKLRMESGRARLEVRDDGVGFHPLDQRTRPANESGGLGLSTMTERATALGGVVEVRSSIGRGTVVEAILPVTAETS